jgi:AcrR family transcriptional regulator
MPYPAEHRPHTRERILDSARKLFNRSGFSAISIDDVMAGAGLTRGGFYNYFSSKEELYAEAITHFIQAKPPEWQRLDFSANGRDLARGIVDAYLSRAHLEDVDNSCPMIGLATDVARATGPARLAYRQVLGMMAGIFENNLGPDTLAGDSNPHQRALALAALCVGGMVLARAVDDQGLADDLRAAAHRYGLALAGWPEA